MRIGLEIEVSDKELLGRLANVKEKNIAKETYRPALFEDAEEKKP